MKWKQKAIWSVVAVLLAFLSIRLVLRFSGELSWQDILDRLSQANPLWIAAALVFMVGFDFFEGEAVLCVLRHMNHRRSHLQGFVYAASDTYFSAITPSASGGQPASAFFMVKDGVPAAAATAALLVNIMMYTLATLTNGLFGIVIRPSFFLHFSVISRIMIVIGVAVLSGLSVVFLILLKSRTLLKRIGNAVIGILKKLHLSRHPERLEARLELLIHEYYQCSALMTGQKKALISVYLLNLAQRVSQLMITISVYMAVGGAPSKIPDLYATQSMVVLGSNCVPIPGSMGVTDYLMVDGFLKLMDHQKAYTLELLSRSISFYLCVAFSGIVTLICFLAVRRRRKIQK